MSLTAFTSTTSATVLNSNFDDKTSALTTQMKAGQKDLVFSFARSSIATGADSSLTSVAFIPPDDLELRVFGASVTDTTASRVLTATLTVDSGDDDYLIENTISVTVTSINGTAHGTRTDYRTTSGTRLKLLKGVRYRLTVSYSAGTATRAYAYVVLRTKRRTA